MNLGSKRVPSDFNIRKPPMFDRSISNNTCSKMGANDNKIRYVDVDNINSSLHASYSDIQTPILLQSRSSFTPVGRKIKRHTRNVAPPLPKEELEDHPLTTRSVISNISNIGKLYSVNQYKLQKLLGEGSFGKVYMCIDKNTGKRRAIKIFDKKIISWKLIGKTQTAEMAVRREIAIMKKLRHPNIVKLIEVLDQEGDDAIYLVLEYVGKYSVQSKIEVGTLTQGQIWGYFRDALLGLLYLHQKAQIVHRDIKPENLLLTRDGKVKIADFGCSAILDDGNANISNTMGSNFFFSPEI
jgi:tRNA A-37 threonylcarbamoyl transferase component Bud32